jgi:hypothetical protein
MKPNSILILIKIVIFSAGFQNDNFQPCCRRTAVKSRCRNEAEKELVRIPGDEYLMVQDGSI